MAEAGAKYSHLEQNLLYEHDSQSEPDSAPTFPLLTSVILGSSTCIPLFAYSFATLAQIRTHKTHGPIEVTFNVSSIGVEPHYQNASIEFFPTEYETSQLWLMMPGSAFGIGIFLLLGLLVSLQLATRLFRRMPVFLLAPIYFLISSAVVVQLASFTYVVIQNKGSDTVTIGGLQETANGNGTYVGRFDPVEWHCGLANYSINANATIEHKRLCSSATAALSFTVYATIFSIPILFAAISYIRQVRN